MPINPTDAQREASRQNGQQSHGPVTPEGKANSSKNAFKFGFYSKSVLAPGESQEEYDAFCARIRASFHCETGYEQIQLDDLCNTEWQLQRCHRLQAQAVSSDAGTRDVNILSQHHARLKRIKKITEDALKTLIREREEAQKKEIEDAALIRRLDLKEGRDRDMTTLGFVFTNKQVDNWIRHTDALQRAREVFRTGFVPPRRS